MDMEIFVTTAQTPLIQTRLTVTMMARAMYVTSTTIMTVLQTLTIATHLIRIVARMLMGTTVMIAHKELMIR